MQIIEGFDLYHKLDTLAKEIANTSTPTVKRLPIHQHLQLSSQNILNMSKTYSYIILMFFSILKSSHSLIMKETYSSENISLIQRYTIPQHLSTTSDTSYSQIHFSFSSSLLIPIA